MIRRRLSADAIQAMVAAIAGRTDLVMTQHQSRGRLVTLVHCDRQPGRGVRVAIYERATVVSWLQLHEDPIPVVARNGVVEGDVSMDAINLIRCAVGWLVGEDLPAWPDLSAEWEWDDPAYGARVESPRVVRDDCGEDCNSKGGA